ncbi:MAG: glycosyltransferase family 4 protein [Parvularculaceae bacterium]
MRFEKTVLQIIPALNEGGAERTTVEIAHAISVAGGRALVATSGGRLSGEIERAGGRIIEMPVHSKNPLTIISNRGRLMRIIDDEKVDILHVRSRAPAWSALLAARATGTPLVSTWHGAYREGNVIKRFYNSGLASADLVIANSAYTAGQIRQSRELGARLRVIHRGADLSVFDPASVELLRIEKLREVWGISADVAFVVLMPARFSDWKGHDVALEAARLLKDDPRYGLAGNFRLIFAGDDGSRREFAAGIRQSIGDAGLGEVIRLVGHCGDMPAAYALADVVISPSTRPEAFGRVAAEAGAMGCVAIGANHGGARETIIDNETGFLTEPGSAASLADAISKAARLGCEGRLKMGEKARRRIVSKFSTDAMAAATLEVYQALLLQKNEAAAGRV